MSDTAITTDHNLAINTLRALALDAVCQAKEGHPGGPLGMAPMVYTLFTRAMKFNPKNPAWQNRDRFVLSAGHASMALYGALHLTGYDLSLEELKQFRQWGSKTPGHPEVHHTVGVETTTGPLGQGFSNAVGMALAEAHLAARFNQPGFDVVNHFTYCICSDGDLQEGISHEAASFAGHLGLGKLIVLYDDNRIQLDGPTSWAFSEDITKRFEAYGWQVQSVEHGDDDVAALDAAILAAQQETSKPSLIRVHTTIGFGLPKQGTPEVHGKAPKPEEVEAAKKNYGWDNFTPFFIPEAGARPWADAGARGHNLESTWLAVWAQYKSQFAEAAQELESIWSGKIPEAALAALPTWEVGAKPVRTRDASQACINALAMELPSLLGGSADLSSSNMTVNKNSGAMVADNLGQRNINFGVREHAMAAIANGLALSGLRPYVATFFTFSDYMKNSIRLAALMNNPVIFVFTHDSIGVGTDGPTHQPIEHLAGLRAIPNLQVIRPSDANETATAWKMALQKTDGPTALVLTRQDLPVLSNKAAGAMRGGYVVSAGEGAKLLLIATGSEVSLALEAQTKLAAQGVQSRVIALPCWDVFNSQPEQYQEAVLPKQIQARVGIEAAASLGWHRWVGPNGALLTLDRFGASAPEKIVFEKLGFTAEHVAAVSNDLLKSH